MGKPPGSRYTLLVRLGIRCLAGDELPDAATGM